MNKGKRTAEAPLDPAGALEKSAMDQPEEVDEIKLLEPLLS